MKLGDRIKRYEAVTRYFATQRMPLIVRVDGKAFHTFTNGMGKPFDANFMTAMVNAARDVAKEMQGFKVAYVQSDEATFCLTDYDNLESQGWFGYNLQKIISVSAAMMSVNLIKQLGTKKLPVFDSRAFNVPIDDVINTFLWRAKDWERDSLQMYSRSFFPHKELQGKKRSDIHEMLHEIEKNWAKDLTMQEKNGTFILAREEGFDIRHDIEPRFEAIKAAIWDLIIRNH